MKVFFDMEFTGLRQNTTLVSIGCVAEDGDSFYAELTDYDREQVDNWVRANVIAHLIYQRPDDDDDTIVHRAYASFTTTAATGEEGVVVLGSKEMVARRLRDWLHQKHIKGAVYGDQRNVFTDRYPRKIEMWSDCLAYDWVLFCQLFGGAPDIPDSVYYIPFDLSTLLRIKGVDPDVNREEYAGIDGSKHNALHDAHVIKACYEKVLGKR